MHDLENHYEKMSKISGVFNREDFAYLMVHGNEIVKSHDLEGLSIKCNSVKDGVNLEFSLLENCKINNPVVICFGVLPEEGIQRINMKGILNKGSFVEFMAYCIFPNGKKVKHYMEGEINIKENASFKYNEIHYHGENGGVKIYPNMNVSIGKNGSFRSNFKLPEGRSGKINLNYYIKAGENSRVELTTKVMGSGNDDINIRENLYLEGDFSKGTIASYIVGKGNSEIKVYNRIEARGRKSIGHIDCIETIMDNAHAMAIPIVDVQNASAKVTHEAAIGGINKKQLEVLMSKGLSEDEATKVILKGLLK